ncbi:MAG: FHA domain-containing protein [Glaciihabitans sp.]
MDEQPDGFITLPPGIADSGTFKRDRPAPPAPIEREEIVFFPAAPGIPVVPVAEPEPEPASESAAESPAEPAAAPAFDVPVAVEVPVAPPQWRLSIEAIGDVVVDGAIFLGRDPVASSAHAAATVLAVNDATKSVSKTHAMFELVDGILRVHDLDSTNGVWVVAPGAEPIEVEPGIPVAVPSGSRVELGDFPVTVTHG